MSHTKNQKYSKQKKASKHCRLLNLFTFHLARDVAAAAKSQPTKLPCPWDSPSKNTGVGCHFLLQCRKVKSGSESRSVVSLLVTPWIAAYQAPPSMGFSRQELLEWVAISFSRSMSHLGVYYLISKYLVILQRFFCY